MPTAKKTASGKYRVTIYDYTDSKGKVHQKTFTAETKREAERLANEYKDGPSVSDLTIGEAVDGYITLKEAALSPSTVRGYRQIYRNLFESSRFGAIKLETHMHNAGLFLHILEMAYLYLRRSSRKLTLRVLCRF